MTLIKRAILALALIAGLTPAIAQVPAPVPAIADSERRNTYSASATTGPFSIQFPLFGDTTDYQNWVEVWLNGVRVSFNDPTFGWTLTSPSGPIANLARPISNAVITFNNPQTGTVQIVGARRPRRTVQFSENAGVPARAINQALSDIVTQNREQWDKTNTLFGRALQSQPGVALGLLPLPSVCVNGFLGFDGTGSTPVCRTSSGTGNITLPVVSGNFACFDGTTGLLKDCGSSSISFTIPGGTTPRQLSIWAGNDPFIEDFGGGAGLADNGPAFNLAIAHGGGVQFKAGLYHFTTKPNVMTDSFRVTGWGGNFTTLSRDYVETDPTRGLLAWTGGHAIVQGLAIVAGGSSTGGAPISVIAAIPPAVPSSCYFANLRQTVTTGTWSYSLYLDGSALVTPNPLGLRTCFLNNVTLFGASVRAAFIKSVIHFSWLGGSVNSAGGTNGDMDITGTAGVTSQSFTMNLDYLGGNLNLDFIIKSNIQITEIAGTLNNTTNTSMITGTGMVIGGSPQSNWTSSTWVSPNQTFYSATNGLTFGPGGAGSPNIQVSPGSMGFLGANGGGYPFSNTVFPLTNRAGSLGASSSGWSGLYLGGSTSGIGQLVPPAIAGSAVWTLPSATSTLATLALAETLTNKSMSGAANTFTNIGLGSLTGFGTGVATALGVNVGTAGSPVVNGGVLGTPSSGTLTNATGLPTTGLTGALQAAQEPAHTGDVTNTAGSLALAYANVVPANKGGAGTITGALKGSGAGVVTQAACADLSDGATACIPQGAWTACTSTPTAQTPGGTPPTFGSNICAFQQNGKTVNVRLSTTVVAQGTGTGCILFPLPVTLKTGFNGGLSGALASGKTLGGLLNQGSFGSSVCVLLYDNTTVIGTGNIIGVSGVLEAN